MLVRFHIFRSAFFRRLHLRLNCRLGRRIRRAIRELTAQLPDNGLGELALDCEDVLQITRVVFRPELLARISAWVRRAAMRTMSPALRTLPSTRRATPSFSQFPGRLHSYLEKESAEVRAATCSPGIFCSTVSKLLTDAIGKIFAAFIIAQVVEARGPRPNWNWPAES